ncbi:ABC transporter ATP-binding protein [Pectinatus sottacetonis]|uniref:ABC transporter ATP-binding protein n=1 Tax=Pectinatus sottacetonis TaxID=1002795 RepID=UPI0018C64DB0|nr:ABC transporter ATP-binding protein [Pectinatus sottacetonis]
MIKLVNVNKSYKDYMVLKNIDLLIQKGETLAIIGASGSGKSTLLKLMIGLERPTTGEIWIKDKEISHMDEEQLDEIRLTMGMVFQYSALFDSMTVAENVAFGLNEHSNFTEKEIEKIVDDKLELVGLKKFKHYMPNELSGGMKKRVSLARAIAFGPEIILYDEPSSGLDPIMAGKIDNLIKYTQKKMNVTSVVVTHDMNSAYYIADRIAMIYKGQIIALGDVKSIRESKDERVQEFISGGRNNI